MSVGPLLNPLGHLFLLVKFQAEDRPLGLQEAEADAGGGGGRRRRQRARAHLRIQVGGCAEEAFLPNLSLLSLFHPRQLNWASVFIIFLSQHTVRDAPPFRELMKDTPPVKESRKR